MEKKTVRDQDNSQKGGSKKKWNPSIRVFSEVAKHPVVGRTLESKSGEPGNTLPSVSLTGAISKQKIISNLENTTQPNFGHLQSRLTSPLSFKNQSSCLVHDFTANNVPSYRPSRTTCTIPLSPQSKNTILSSRTFSPSLSPSRSASPTPLKNTKKNLQRSPSCSLTPSSSLSSSSSSSSSHSSSPSSASSTSPHLSFQNLQSTLPFKPFTYSKPPKKGSKQRGWGYLDDREKELKKRSESLHRQWQELEWNRRSFFLGKVKDELQAVCEKQLEEFKGHVRTQKNAVIDEMEIQKVRIEETLKGDVEDIDKEIEALLELKRERLRYIESLEREYNEAKQRIERSEKAAVASKTTAIEKNLVTQLRVIDKMITKSAVSN